MLSIATAEKMRAVGHALGQGLGPPGSGAVVVGVEGELGAGKTTLVGGVLSSLGIKGAIRSPTYTLIEPYEAGGRQIFHLDLYRLTDAREVEGLGIRDLLNPAAVLLIEWPSHGAGMLPATDLDLLIDYAPSPRTGRSVTLRGASSAGHKLVERVLAAISE